jgi:hypothetical protein
MIALDLTLTEMEIKYWAIKYSIAIYLFIPKSPHDPSPLYIRVYEPMMYTLACCLVLANEIRIRKSSDF